MLRFHSLYGSFNSAEANVSKVEISDENKSVGRQRKCVVVIALLVVLAAVVVTLVVYFTLGQHDQVVLQGWNRKHQIYNYR